MYIDGIKIPLNPEKNKRSLDIDSFEYNVIGLGDIIIPGNKKLKKWNFSSFFPADTDRWKCSPPGVYMTLIQKIIDEVRPCSFIIVQYLDDGKPSIIENTMVVINSFDIEHVFTSQPPLLTH